MVVLRLAVGSGATRGLMGGVGLMGQVGSSWPTCVCAQCPRVGLGG
jgi:hypothetical protein